MRVPGPWQAVDEVLPGNPMSAVLLAHPWQATRLLDIDHLVDAASSVISSEAGPQQVAPDITIPAWSRLEARAMTEAEQR